MLDRQPGSAADQEARRATDSRRGTCCRWSRYFKNNPEHLVYIFTTRGCPFKCIFCQKELTGRGFRVRSTEAIVDELEHIVKTYDPGVILFVDEILTLRRKRIHEMCDEILRRGLKFEWIANTRADCVDYPLLKHMHRAGCRRIYYGWESGSQRMLDVLKKDLTPEEIVEAARMTRRAGIWAKVYLIVGSPGETAQDIAETEKVLRLAGPDLVRVSVFNPLIGTESWDNYQANIDASDLRENYVSPRTAPRTSTSTSPSSSSRRCARTWFGATRSGTTRYRSAGAALHGAYVLLHGEPAVRQEAPGSRRRTGSSAAGPRLDRRPGRRSRRPAERATGSGARPRPARSARSSPWWILPASPTPTSPSRCTAAAPESRARAS